MAERLWSPTPELIQSHNSTAFIQFANEAYGQNIETWDELQEWSVTDMEAFWDAVWEFGGVVGEKGDIVIEPAQIMRKTRFFPNARLNYAENLLRKTGMGDALVFRGEDKVQSRLTWNDLHAMTSKIQQAMKKAGVQKGDRVAAMMPNLPETVAFMLAATSFGAIWSSCSPDFGERGVLDRFQQIEPTFFLSCDGYYYNGKTLDISEKLKPILDGLPSIETVVIVPYIETADTVVQTLPKAQTLSAFLEGIDAKEVEFDRLPFAHPLYILFSSGTTGIPKCIVHSAGGALLTHIKEQKIINGMKPGDRLFFFTTCGWMMWNWLVSALASKTTLMLYDGSPFAPDGNVLFDYAQEEKFNFLGTSAKFIDAIKKAELSPAKTHDLSNLRVLFSTGSPLAPESHDYIYTDIKKDVHVNSMSGGTDIMGCFVLGIAVKPVYKGEIQGPALGMAVDVWDDDGKPVREVKGELVCHEPFPSMPLMFWNDTGDDKYHAAYFDRFDNCWCHGDFAEWTSTGGMIIHGRSDATLNPGGVRIGTAEIYNQVEQLEEILEAICIGQEWEGDARVVLFVRMKDDYALDDDLIKQIKAKIRAGASPRHVPAKVIEVEDIPRTKSGKIVELAVREVVHGRPVKNKEALANPEALEHFKDIEALKS